MASIFSALKIELRAQPHTKYREIFLIPDNTLQTYEFRILNSYRSTDFKRKYLVFKLREIYIKVVGFFYDYYFFLFWLIFYLYILSSIKIRP